MCGVYASIYGDLCVSICQQLSMSDVTFNVFVDVIAGPDDLLLTTHVYEQYSLIR